MSDVSIGLNSGSVSVSVTSQPSPNSSFPKSTSSNGSSSSSIMGDEVCKFIAGGISGTLAKGAVSPFDRIKILRQGEHKIYGDLTLFRSVTQLVKNEGFFQLWRGLPALVIRIFPYAGFQFYSNDKYRIQWKKYGYQTQVQVGSFNVPFRNLVCGSLAGVTATLFTYPLDLVRTRILYTSQDQAEYKNFSTTVRTIYNQPGGFRNFYAGLRPALFGMIFYAGLSFGTFETLREKAQTHDHISFIPLKNERGDIYYSVNFVMGATAAVISQLFVFPIDTARRRMQNAHLITTQNNLKDKMSVYQTLRDLWKRSPNPYFPNLIYRGFTLNVLRAAPATAISYATHDHLRNLLGVPRRS